MTGLANLRAAVTAVTLGVFMAAAAIGAGTGAARAATLDLAALGFERGSVVASTTAGSVAVGEDPGAPGILQLFASDPGSELTLESFDLSDLALATFAVLGPDVPPDQLSGVGATAIGTDEGTDLVQFLFEGVLGTGIYAPFDGDAVLVELQAAGLLPFSDGFNVSKNFTLTFTVLRPAGDPSVIPLPAGLPLLLAGLGALAVLRRAGRRPD